MSKSTQKTAYANQRQREENVKANAAFVAKQWDQIRDSRLRAEKARQIRADRLGRNSVPMPGYPDFVHVVQMAA